MPNQNENLKPSRFQMGLIKRIGIDKYLADLEQGKGTEVMMHGDTEEKFRQMENQTWYKGDAHQLEHLYKTRYAYQIYPDYGFWRVVNTNLPRAHYPMPSMISNAFSSVLFSNRPNFTVDSGSKARDKKHTDRLEQIFAVNDILTLLQESAQLQSYSGGVAFKINLDSTITDVPLITAYPKEQYYVHKKYGQTIYIDFFDEYGKYTLRSRYGRGYIAYNLFLGTKEANLDAVEETADLKDIAFIDSERNLIPFLFATEIPNKGHGHSDYEGLITSFHALDETYSSMINYIRKTKPNTFVTEDLIPKDLSGKPRPFNEFDTIITMLDSTPDGTSTAIDRDEISIDVSGYLNSFVSLRDVILQKAGISPSTLGIEGGGANASAEALNIRERASARTRNEKLSV